MKKTYTIYHIPGVKVGCTDQEPKARVRAQGHTEFEVLEEWEYASIASIREQALQKEYRYPVDDCDYMSTIQRGFLSEQSKAKAKESCRLSEAYKATRTTAHMQTPEVRAKVSVKNKKPVNQIDLKTGAIVRRWESAKDAAEALGCNRMGISQVLGGRAKSTGGYGWQYE